MSGTILMRLVAVIAPLSFACGGGGGSVSDGGSGADASSAQNGCHVTLAGALSGTFTCFQPPVATWSQSNGMTVLYITSDGSPQKGSLNIVSMNSLTAAPAVGTYEGTDTRLYTWATSIREEATMKSWGAGAPAGIVNTAASYSLTISGVGSPTGPADNQTYPVHGSQHVLTSADPLSGATGEVTVDIVF